MAEQKYVADTTLNYYDPKIKAWFENKVNTVPVMDIVYDEENRILEFIETSSAEV